MKRRTLRAVERARRGVERALPAPSEPITEVELELLVRRRTGTVIADAFARAVAETRR